MPEKKLKIKAQGHEISVIAYENQDDFISLTDIAKQKNPNDPRYIIQNWMRNRNTLEFIGLWEQMHNPSFNRVEFDTFRNSAGLNSFSITPKQWIESTSAIGIVSKAGRYGGTYAHKDIAFEFASWVSPEFKLYIIKDYQRLRQEEQYRLSTDWNLRRELSKTNYRIHTDAIKENLIDNKLTKMQIGMTYADEADLLNVALFGCTAKEWKTNNPDKDGNMRDYATIEELIVMANLESANAQFIADNISQSERLKKLNQMARFQLKSLLNNSTVNKLEQKNNKLT
ncbi:KilA-N domain-containing protein [Clostridium tetani]|uniref:KilA-N domain-containing protein n=1 Tax=Clostridium tetani TaxID=1513 RepID=UPI0024A8B477|nr:KilA-N domain-containing protein [Clostridium tetani]